MAKRLEYEIGVDSSKGVSGLKAFSSAAKKELNAVADSADDASTNAQKLAKVLSGLASDMESELKGAAAAADALAQALGPEIAGRADLDSVVADLNKMGLSFDEIKADAAVLATSLKELDAVQLSGVTQGATRTKQGMDKIVDGADQANSVVANMVGNATQDLGQLGGIAGSAGVAVGQLAERFVDVSTQARKSGQGFGAILKSFSSAAAPIAAIGGSLAVIDFAMGKIEGRDAFDRERVDAYTAALKDTHDAATAVDQVLTEIGEIKLAPPGGVFFGSDIDVSKIMDRNAITTADFRDAVLGGDEGLIAMEARLAALNATSSDTAALLIAIATEQDRLGIASGKADRFLRANAKTIDQINDEIRRAKDPMSTFRHYWEQIINDLRDGRIDSQATVGVMNQLANTLGLTTDEVRALAQAELDRQLAAIGDSAAEADRKLLAFAEGLVKIVDARAEVARILEEPLTIEAAVEGASEFISERFALKNIASDYEAAVDGLRQSVKDSVFDFNLATEAGRANEAALQNLAGALIPEIGANYEQAGGSLERFAQLQQQTGAKLRRHLEDAGFSATEAAALVKRLLPLDGASIETEFRLIGAETAEAQVAQILPLLDALELSPDIAKEVVVAIREGAGPEEILAIVDRGLAEGATVPVEVEKPTNVNEVVNDTQDTLDALKLTIPAAVRVTSSNLKQYLASIGALDAGGTAKGVGGIAGEKGPEIVDGKYLVTGPTYVPPGTRVTSRRQTAVILRNGGARGLKRYDSGGVVGGPQTVNINVNAAVVGNRYDVMRAVQRANLDKVRLLGTRG